MFNSAVATEVRSGIVAKGRPTFPRNPRTDSRADLVGPDRSRPDEPPIAVATSPRLSARDGPNPFHRPSVVVSDSRGRMNAYG
jgi:hypothetical protein